MIELAPGLYRVPTTPFNAINSFVFVEDSGELTLVDAGLKGAPKKLLAAVASLGKEPSDVTRIVLTHTHLDHAGGAARMCRETGARVHVHEADTPFARAGESPPVDRRSFTARVLAHLPGGDFDPVEVDQTLADGQLLDVGGGLLVIHTPGHTPGHVALLHERSGTLITGDALFNWRGITFSPRFFCSDIPMSRETAWRLGDVDYEVAAFMHGPEIRDGAKGRITEFLSKKLRGRTP